MRDPLEIEAAWGTLFRVLAEARPTKRKGHRQGKTVQLGHDRGRRLKVTTRNSVERFLENQGLYKAAETAQVPRGYHLPA